MTLKNIILDYGQNSFGNSAIIHADCMEWLSRLPKNSIQSIVTDPPYGFREYEVSELKKRAAGNGGIWRIPPSFDGNTRAPLPRFTALDQKDRKNLVDFFTEWAILCTKVLCPGAHVFVASNAFIVPLLTESLSAGGLEFRGQIIREVRTLRGGDRPKNAEQEFPFVSSMPRGCYEPWVIFRKPLAKRMKVSDALREFGTGGIRRLPDGNPFGDLVPSERTPRAERAIADHPSLKPQSLMRLLAYISLPLGRGLIVDPFCGSGSTIAAAEAIGVNAFGIERHRPYFDVSASAVPALSAIESKSDALLNLTETRDVFSNEAICGIAAATA